MILGVIGDYAFHWMDDVNEWNIRYQGNFLKWDYETGDDLGYGEIPEEMVIGCDNWFRKMMNTFKVPEDLNGSEMVYCYVSYNPEENDIEARLEGIDPDEKEFVYYIEEQEDGSFV